MSSLSERRLRAAFFTAHLNLLFLRFSVHCSSTASLDILFHHRIYIFTLVAVAVCKTCPFVLHTYCDVSTRSRTTQKNRLQNRSGSKPDRIQFIRMCINPLHCVHTGVVHSGISPLLRKFHEECAYNTDQSNEEKWLLLNILAIWMAIHQL